MYFLWYYDIYNIFNRFACFWPKGYQLGSLGKSHQNGDYLKNFKLWPAIVKKHLNWLIIYNICCTVFHKFFQIWWIFYDYLEFYVLNLTLFMSWIKIIYCSTHCIRIQKKTFIGHIFSHLWYVFFCTFGCCSDVSSLCLVMHNYVCASSCDLLRIWKISTTVLDLSWLASVSDLHPTTITKPR